MQYGIGVKKDKVTQNKALPLSYNSKSTLPDTAKYCKPPVEK